MKNLILLVFAFSCFAFGKQIRIQSESFVEGPQIELGEIAKFEDLSESEISSLKKIPLSDSPNFGEVRSFTSEAIAQMLRSKIKDETLKLEIPTTVIIKNKASKIDSASVKNRILEGVRQTCIECDIIVRDLIVPVFEKPSPKSTWDLTPDWTRVRGSFQMPLEIVNELGQKNIQWITGKVVLSRKVVVLKRNLLFGERIEESDIEIQKRDVTFKPDSVFDPKEAIGAQTKAPLSANTLLTRSQFQKPPALVRGQSVTVMAKESGWNISIKGVAEQTGFIGDLVKVLNPLTKKTVVGVVISEGMVEAK